MMFTEIEENSQYPIIAYRVDLYGDPHQIIQWVDQNTHTDFETYRSELGRLANTIISYKSVPKKMGIVKSFIAWINSINPFLR